MCTTAAFKADCRLSVLLSMLHDPKTLPLWQSVVAGSLAGLSQQILCYPFETVRTRLSLGGAATGLGQSYTGICDCFVKTMRIEGVGAIYKGLSASW